MAATVVAKSTMAPSRLRSKRGFWEDVFRRFIRNRLAIVGLAIAVFVTVLGAGASLWAPEGFNDQDLTMILKRPSAQSIFGTDYLGRSMLTRIMYGARTSLIVAVSTEALALLIGVPLGALAGWRGGAIDWVISRIVDIFSSLPWYLIAIYLMSVLQPGMRNIIIALAVAGWVTPCRLIRAQFMSLRQREFVLASQAIGASPFHIMRRHLLPNSLTPIVIAVALGIPGAVFGEAGLSFLGLGIGPPQPSLGQMVQDGLDYFLVFWHMVLIPAGMIALIVIGFTMMGDGLRDALDPQQTIR